MSSDGMGGFDIDSDHHDTVALGSDGTVPSSNLLIRKASSSSRTSTDSPTSGSGLSLVVEIPESKSEHDKVLFLIHTKSNLPNFKAESRVWRKYEEFVWLHDNLANCPDYTGFIIPPAPPKPDFENSRVKLRNLNSLEASITEMELNKLKDELQEEYIASFKKTVAMHENFLKRLAKHSKIRNDTNFVVFLEYDGELSVRTQNPKEKAVAMLKNLTKSVDEQLVLSNQVDNDQFFRDEKNNLIKYHKQIKEAASSADHAYKNRMNFSQSMLQSQIACSDIANASMALPNIKTNESEVKLVESFTKFFEKAQKMENLLAADEDWKLNDTLKYYQRESEAAKMVLYQRSKLLADYENSTKALDKARERRKDVAVSEALHKISYEKFESISSLAKDEIDTYLHDRVKYFDDNLLALAKLQTENTKKYAAFIKEMITEIKSMEYVPDDGASAMVTNGSPAAQIELS